MYRRLFLAVLGAAACLALPLRAAAAAPPLQLEIYNPGAASMFPVSSEIVTGATEAVLVDAQFQRNDAMALVQRIQATGKRLTTVYISHSDPDYYFGLDVIHAAFPDAKIVATAATVAAIKATMTGKQAYWGPMLKDNAPRQLVLPAVLEGDRLQVDGQPLQVEGLKGPDPLRTYVWIPSLRAVVGGVVVSSGSHVWIADTQTTRSRQAWLSTLRQIEKLRPAKVVPGHFLGDMPAGTDAVTFTARYLETFEMQAARARDSAALVAAMQAAYPGLGGADGLALSAKVVKGEMKWPQ